MAPKTAAKAARKTIADAKKTAAKTTKREKKERPLPSLVSAKGEEDPKADFKKNSLRSLAMSSGLRAKLKGIATIGDLCALDPAKLQAKCRLSDAEMAALERELIARRCPFGSVGSAVTKDEIDAVIADVNKMIDAAVVTPASSPSLPPCGKASFDAPPPTGAMVDSMPDTVIDVFMSTEGAAWLTPGVKPVEAAIEVLRYMKDFTSRRPTIIGCMDAAKQIDNLIKICVAMGIYEGPPEDLQRVTAWLRGGAI